MIVLLIFSTDPDRVRQEKQRKMYKVAIVRIRLIDKEILIGLDDRVAIHDDFCLDLIH